MLKLSKLKRFSQNDFWEDVKISGIVFPDGDVFEKDVYGWGSGFVINNSYSHSNGNFPFWSNGQTLPFLIRDGYLYFK